MRTINLRQNARLDWFVNVTASNGKKIAPEESHPTAAAARRAFGQAGRHMPFARMVLHRPAMAPVILRPGKASPPMDDPTRWAVESAQVLMRKPRH